MRSQARNGVPALPWPETPQTWATGFAFCLGLPHFYPRPARRAERELKRAPPHVYTDRVEWSWNDQWDKP